MKTHATLQVTSVCCTGNGLSATGVILQANDVCVCVCVLNFNDMVYITAMIFEFASLLLTLVKFKMAEYIVGPIL